MTQLWPTLAIAQGDLTENGDFIMLALALAGVMIIAGFAMIISRRYKRCPSNKVLVIYGKTSAGESSKCLHGGGAFVWPLIQNYDYLSLDPIQIEIPLEGALSIENIRVSVPSVFTVAIGTEYETMNNAAIRLLSQSTAEIMKQAEDIIFGQLRQVIASMRIEEINKDRDVFLSKVQQSLEPELAKIGLVLINVNIKDITDESGYIEAIGRKAASEAIKQAEVDVAQQVRYGAIGVAEAEKEQAIKVAEATKIREIGTSEADRDRLVRLAELEKERIIGEQTAGFEQEAQVRDKQREMRVRVADANAKAQVGEQAAALEQEAQVRDREREMRVRVADANAKAVVGENTAKAEVADANASLKVKEANAFQVGETRKREADAAVREAQYIAEARAAEAEGHMIEAEKRAELESAAKAEKAQTIVAAQATAEQHRILAEGEAAAIYVKLEAEARGQYEILVKKGEGLKAIVASCGGANEAFKMMMLEHIDHVSDNAAKAISNIKFDKVVVWDGGNGEKGEGGTAGFIKSLAGAIPPAMQMMKDIGGVDMPEYFGKIADDAPVSVDATEA
jgi:flotillin